jgi:hypothetical protein
MSDDSNFHCLQELRQRFTAALGASEFLYAPQGQRKAQFDRVWNSIDSAVDAALEARIGKNQEQMLKEFCEQQWPGIFIDQKTARNREDERYFLSLSSPIQDFDWTHLTVQVGERSLDVKLDLNEMVLNHGKRLYAEMFTEGWRCGIRPSVGISERSLPAFDAMLADELNRKPPALLDVAEAARELGINKGRAQVKRLGSTRVHHYVELEALFRELRAGAGKMAAALTGEDGVPPSALFVTLRDDLRFAMEKPEGKTKWMLAEESLPAVRQHLGLTPKVAIGAVRTQVGAWGLPASQSREVG